MITQDNIFQFFRLISVDVKAILSKRGFFVVLLIFLLCASTLFFLYLPKGIYLRNHSYQIDISPNNSFKNYDKLNKLVSNKLLVISGEVHGTQYNYDLKLKLFRYLNDYLSISHFVDEVGFGFGYVINAYFSENNQTYLEYLMNSLSSTAAYNLQTEQFLKKLSMYQNTTTFRYTGIDVDHQIDIGIFALHLILSKYQIVTKEVIEIQNIVSKLEEYNFDSLRYYNLWNNMTKFIEKLSNQAANGSYYKSTLDEDYIDFTLIIKNLQKSLEMQELFSRRSYADAFHLREKAIYENFIDIQHKYPEDKFYGHFGSGHILQYPLQITNYKESFVEFLLTDYRDKITSIMPYYIDSSGRLSDSGNFQNFKISNTPPFKSGAIRDQYPNNSTSLVTLTEKNSPFVKRELLLQKSPSNTSTTDYFQVIIVVKNSPAVDFYVGST